MSLKSDQKKHQKIPTYGAAPYLYITLLVLNLTGWLLILIPIQWVILTVVIRNTEEKWLYELHGEAYKDYCARVNRWIPLKKI